MLRRWSCPTANWYSARGRAYTSVNSMDRDTANTMQCSYQQPDKAIRNRLSVMTQTGDYITIHTCLSPFFNHPDLQKNGLLVWKSTPLLIKGFSCPIDQKVTPLVLTGHRRIP